MVCAGVKTMNEETESQNAAATRGFVLVSNETLRIQGVIFSYLEENAKRMAELKNCTYVEVTLEVAQNIQNYRYDTVSREIVHIPEKPVGDNWKWDSQKDAWIDTTPIYTLDELKEMKWTEIKEQRDRIEFSGFVWNDHTFDSDQVSQGRIMGAAAAGIDQIWTLANNTTVDLTGDELKELYAALQRHVATVHERGRIARNKIDLAMTVQDIEAVTL